jgi:hypothetical protein
VAAGARPDAGCHQRDQGRASVGRSDTKRLLPGEGLEFPRRALRRSKPNAEPACRAEPEAALLPVVVDAVVPARNEEPTVGRVVEACRGCRYVREVIVVDDGSTDATAEVARAAGAKVVERAAADGGSKGHAMWLGVCASDAGALLFVDADLVGVTSRHLDEICEPFVEGRADMSLGFFDYGLLNPIVRRLPPTTGERILPRWVFEAVPAERLGGYTIEMMLNAVVAEARLATVARTMEGVTHRTKRDKLGWREGIRRTLAMYAELLRLPLDGTVRLRLYWHYARGLEVVGSRTRSMRARRPLGRRTSIGPSDIRLTAGHPSNRRTSV